MRAHAKNWSQGKVRMKSAQARVALFCVCASFFNQAAFADVVPLEEYSQRLKIAQTIDPQGPTPFGEQVNPYTGDVTFSQTDVTIPGIGPTIRLVRNHVSAQAGEGITKPYSMGDWTLSIPRIETLADINWHTVVQVNPGLNWHVDTTDPANKSKRCTYFDRPAYDGSLDNPSRGWNGMTLVTEDGSSQSVLKRNTSSNLLKPSIPEASNFPAVTQQSWQIGCLPQTSNGEEGEAFLAVSPDGTKYWLDHLSGVRAQTIFEVDPSRNGINPNYMNYQGRILAQMSATKVEDRFGNWVEYHYSGDELDYIDASDGRYIDIDWMHVNGDGVIQEIKVQPGTSPAHTWHYTYATSIDSLGYTHATLTDVELPDHTHWTFSLNSLGFPITDIFLDHCGAVRDEGDLSNNHSGGVITSTITHPSGLVGTFNVSATWHGRSYVQGDCRDDFNHVSREMIPPLFGSMSLVSKTFTGPGLPSLTWNYSYKPAVGSTVEDQCALAGNCVDETWVDVEDPQHNRTRHTYSTRWGPHEGKEIKTEYFEGNSNLQRTVWMNYAAADHGPYPSVLGSSMMDWRTNNAKQETLTPLQSQVTSQQGETFSWTANSFNVFARPLAVVKSSSLGFGRAEVTAYDNNLSKWVLGQVTWVKCVGPTDPLPMGCGSSGIVMSSTTYDATTDKPWKTFAFGKLQQVFGYNSDGTIATVDDAENHRTVLSSWKRGIPQNIHFPATPEAPSGATISASVNDFGLIAWTEDPFGSRTCYDYDAMDRLKALTHPSETAPHICNNAWNPTAQNFTSISASEYGLGAGHWRQTITTGANEKITYFDALWRPVVVRERGLGSAISTWRFQRFAYDANGGQSFASYPSNVNDATTGIHTTYDALGRVTQVAQDWEGPGQLKTKTLYQPTAFKTTVTDPAGNVTTTSYRAFDQPATDQPISIAHPAGVFTDITRDIFGKPTAIMRHGAGSGSLSLTRKFVYNVNQQLCKRIEPETFTSVMTYDAVGNLDWTASGQRNLNAIDCSDTSSVPTLDRVSRTYDYRNRLQTLTFPDFNGSQSWSYTKDSLPAQVNTVNEGGDATVINTYSYNRRRLLTEETQSQPGLSGVSLTYYYDNNAALASITYPDDTTVSYAPNALGQPTKANSYATGVSYYPNGAMSGFNYGNGIVHSMTQNDRLLPEHSIDSGVLNDSYDYDLNGNVLAITDLPSGHGNRTMTYDALDRLTTTTSPMFAGGTSYSYDVLDNLTHVKAPGRDEYYCYHTSKRTLETIQTLGCNVTGGQTKHAFDFDDRGNLSNKDGKHYQFDFGNRLRDAETQERYRYDAYGRRVAAISEYDAPTQGTIYSYYGQDGVLRYQRNERTGKETNYVTLNGSLLAGISNTAGPAGVGLSVDEFNYTGSYVVSWTDSSSATSYELQERVGSGGSWTTIQTGMQTSRALTGKALGTYYYQARACAAGECSGWSNNGKVIVALPLSPDLDMPAASSTGDYTVEWTTSVGASSYELQEKLDAGNWITIQTTSATSRNFSGKHSGTYAYQVHACSNLGCGAWSDQRAITVTVPPTMAPIITTPANNETGAYVVSWNQVADAATYTLRRATESHPIWNQVYEGPNAMFNETGLADDTYGYQVHGCNAVGCGPWSDLESTTVNHVSSQAPAMPATLTGSVTPGPGASYHYTANWSASSGATSYDLKANGIPIYSGPGTTYSVNAPGGTKEVWVRACNPNGCSSYQGPLILAANGGTGP